MTLKMTRLIAAALAILTLAACAPAPSEPPTDTADSFTGDTVMPPVTPGTEGETEPTAPARPIYEDLSHSLPPREEDSRKSVTVTVEGEGSTADVLLPFDGESGLFTISLGKMPYHSTTDCDICGFAEDGSGLLLAGHGKGYSTVTVNLATPIPLDAVMGMEITFRTDKELKSSSLRVFPANETDGGAMINTTPSLAGAVTEAVTRDLGLDPEKLYKLSDAEGNLSSFQLMFRDKDTAALTVESLRILVSPTRYLDMEESLSGRFYSRGEALQAIADEIAARFDRLGLSAEITVKGGRFRQNTSASVGSIQYEITVTLADGTRLTGEGKLEIPPLSGGWLSDGEGDFGSAHDSKDQWQTTFDPLGMVLLTDNTLSCAEGVTTMEYALIPASAAYDDPAHLWLPPQILDMSEDGFSTLFVNAYPDHGSRMTEGESYRLLLRGVTANGNYILHLDIPFTYTPLSPSAEAALSEALGKVTASSLTCAADTADKAVFVESALTELIGSEAVAVKATVIGEGVNSARMRVSLRYTADVDASRLPAYSVNGEALRAVYGYEGRAFTVADMVLPYGAFDGTILLSAPYDGDPSVSVAAPAIQKLFGAPLQEVRDHRFGYASLELCTPVPVRLSWTDSAAAGKTYTVTLSRSPDLSDPDVYTTAETFLEVKHLFTDTAYYWQVSDGESLSQVFTFRTEAGVARFVEVDGVSNFRDIGGFMTHDGKRVKQGMVYRSAQLNGVTAEGLAVCLEDLALKTELDLRGSGAPALGNTVTRKVIPMQWYQHIFKPENYASTRQTISAFAAEENYPINFHCSMGRDRTGTTSFLILGLLGVDQEILQKEYFSSYLSQAGAFDPDEFKLQIINIDSLINGFKPYAPEGTLQEQIEAYLLTAGVTEAEIASIRAILLEE